MNMMSLLLFHEIASFIPIRFVLSVIFVRYLTGHLFKEEDISIVLKNIVITHDTEYKQLVKK